SRTWRLRFAAMRCAASMAAKPRASSTRCTGSTTTWRTRSPSLAWRRVLHVDAVVAVLPAVRPRQEEREIEPLTARQRGTRQVGDVQPERGFARRSVVGMLPTVDAEVDERRLACANAKPLPCAQHGDRRAGRPYGDGGLRPLSPEAVPDGARPVDRCAVDDAHCELDEF